MHSTKPMYVIHNLHNFGEMDFMVPRGRSGIHEKHAEAKLRKYGFLLLFNVLLQCLSMSYCMAHIITPLLHQTLLHLRTNYEHFRYTKHNPASQILTQSSSLEH